MEKYICPICGKDYSNPGDLSKCVVECAMKEEERIKEKELKEKELTEIKDNIYECYENLKKAINSYNIASENEKITSELRVEKVKKKPFSDTKNFKEEARRKREENTTEINNLMELFNKYCEEINSKIEDNKTYEENLYKLARDPKVNEYCEKIYKEICKDAKNPNLIGGTVEGLINTLFN